MGWSLLLCLLHAPILLPMPAYLALGPRIGPTPRYRSRKKTVFSKSRVKVAYVKSPFEADFAKVTLKRLFLEAPLRLLRKSGLKAAFLTKPL